jgi:hypothetical protein
MRLPFTLAVALPNHFTSAFRGKSRPKGGYKALGERVVLEVR